MADSECLKIFLESDEIKMQTYTYVSKGKFELMEKPKPVLIDDRDAIVKVTLASICSSDLHIKHGSVPRAVPGITVGHEMVLFVGNAFSVKKAMLIIARIKMGAGLLAAA